MFIPRILFPFQRALRTLEYGVLLAAPGLLFPADRSPFEWTEGVNGKTECGRIHIRGVEFGSDFGKWALTIGSMNEGMGLRAASLIARWRAIASRISRVSPGFCGA